MTILIILEGGVFMAAKSCSSFIIAGSETKTGDIIFAKNSDRPFNESQPLI